MDDFSLPALYAALDSRRQARGLSWSDVTREMNGGTQRRGIHSLSPSTVVATRFRKVMEADGVLQMLRWLDRSPEAFVDGFGGVETRLPEVPPGRVLRFDTRRLHSALDERRAKRKVSWAQISHEIGVAASALMRLSRGGRTSFPQVMRIVRWLGEPAARFTRLANR